MLQWKLTIHVVNPDQEEKMSLATALSLTRHIANGAYRNLSELVRTSAIYLGIAVLVSAFMVLGMPVLRNQVAQMHRSVIDTLAPEDAQIDDNFAQLQEGPQVSSVRLDSIPGSGLLPAPAGGKPSSAEKPPASPAARLQPRISADQAQINVTEITAAQNGVRDLTNTQVEALVNYISRKYLVSQDAALLFVDIAHSTGGEYKVDPLLLLAVMAIESRFNPYAGGPRGGATGLMQIMSSVHRDKVNRFGRGESGFYNPAINGKIGAYILAECINRRGTVALGLVCYVGASDPSKDGGYAEKVQAERHRMALAASIPARD